MGHQEFFTVAVAIAVVVTIGRAVASRVDVDQEDVVDTRRIRRELTRAQRDKLNDMYRKGKISDDIRRSISRTIDLQEQRPSP